MYLYFGIYHVQKYRHVHWVMLNQPYVDPTSLWPSERPDHNVEYFPKLVDFGTYLLYLNMPLWFRMYFQCLKHFYSTIQNPLNFEIICWFKAEIYSRSELMFENLRHSKASCCIQYVEIPCSWSHLYNSRDARQ